MKKRVIHIGTWLFLVLWFTIIMGFVSAKNDEILCKQINIEIQDSSTVKFVEDKMIRDHLRNSGHDLQGYPIADINLRNIESMIEENPYVSNAEVYTDVDGTLSISIDQRTPLMRVMPKGQKGYYIDREGVVLPLSDHYSPLILLLTGYLDIPMLEGEGVVRHIDLNADPDLELLLNLAVTLNDNAFWKDQVVQLYCAPNGDYELIPRVGAHQVLLGELDNYNEKLDRLRLLYEQGFKKYGWNTYEKINLKYSNQIICTKR